MSTLVGYVYIVSLAVVVVALGIGALWVGEWLADYYNRGARTDDEQ